MKRCIPILLAYLLFCTSPTDQPESNVSISDCEIHLTGQVNDEAGKPLKGVVVELRSGGLKDTTGSDGSYCLYKLKELAVIRPLGKREVAEVSDTVDVYQQRQLISSIAVFDQIATLPDIDVVQRDISGKLTCRGDTNLSISALLRAKKPADSTVRKINLWHNVENGSYSGFVYFVASATVNEYEVAVVIQNRDSLVTGISKTITFPSMAGDIEIPEFSCEDVIHATADSTITITTGATITIDINDTTTLHAVASDRFFIIKNYIWALDGINYNDTTDSGTVRAWNFQTPGIHTVLVKAENSIGKFSNPFALRVNVVPIAPVVNGQTDTAIEYGDSITLRATASDNGRVVKFIWALDGTTFSDTSSESFITTKLPFLKVRYTETGYPYLDSLQSGSPSVDYNYSGVKKINIPVKAIDDEGVVSTIPAICRLQVKLVAPNITIKKEGYLGDAVVYRAAIITPVSVLKDSIVIQEVPLAGSAAKAYVWARDGKTFCDTLTSDTIMLPAAMAQETAVGVKALSKNDFTCKPVYSVAGPVGSIVSFRQSRISVRTGETVKFSTMLSVMDSSNIAGYIWSVESRGIYDTTTTGEWTTAFDKSATEEIVRVRVYKTNGMSYSPALCRVAVQLKDIKFKVALTMQDTSVDLNSKISFNAKLNDAGPTILKYVWSMTQKGVTTQFPDSTKGTFTYQFSEAGTASVKVECHTKELTDIPQDVCNVRVIPFPPRVTMLTQDTTVERRDTVTFRASAADDGNILRYQWLTTDNSGNGVPFFIDGDTAGTARFVFDKTGNVGIIARALDNDSAWGADTCNVKVIATPPTITMLTPDTTVDIYDTVTFRVSAFDNDSVIQRFNWSASGTTLISQKDSGNYSAITLSFRNDGIKYVNCTAVENHGTYSAAARCTVTVLKNVPTVSIINADTTIYINDTVTFRALATDNDPVAGYSWIAPTGVLVKGGESARIRFPTKGTTMVICKAIDKDRFESVPDTCMVNVLSSPPTVTMLTPDTTVDIHNTINFKASAADNGTITSYNWEWIPEQAGSPFQANLIQAQNGTARISFHNTGNGLVFIHVKDNSAEFSNLDTCKVTVIAQAPTVTMLTPDTTISINDTAVFRAAAIDNEKHYYIWNSYAKTSAETYKIVFFGTGIQYITVRAVDEDGLLSEMDTCKVTVVSP